MTQFEAGPACTQALAWLGADVVKVEMPGRGDRARGVDRARNEAYAPLFCAWNANKRSVAIDLRNDLGRALLLRLVRKFDVLVENYGPGVMERLGVDDETLRAVNPGSSMHASRGSATAARMPTSRSSSRSHRQRRARSRSTANRKDRR